MIKKDFIFRELNLDLKKLSIALLTVSDTRSLKDDKSGDMLSEFVATSNHSLIDRQLVKDDIYEIRAITSTWIANENIQVIISTGGTGFTGRDSTPEAIEPLFDKQIDGFGELFRQISYEEIGSSTIQSRATAGIANGTLIFVLPGSSNAAKTAWDKILRNQLDLEFKPCNFAELIPRFKEKI